jgi:hypothetical protein
VAGITSLAATQVDATTLHTTTILADHIGEHTGAHTVVFDNLATTNIGIVPNADDGAYLGTTNVGFSDLFLASGAVISYASSDTVLTHTAGVLTLGTGTLKITTPTNVTKSVVTTDGAQSITGKTMGAFNFAADAQANDTYVITLSPAPAAYTTGMIIVFYAKTINTGAATLNVNGLGAKTIVKRLNTTLANGDILAGMYCMVVYDGATFVLINPVVN